MTSKIADRVKETTTTTGTGTLSLDGAVTGYRTFVAGIGDAMPCYYTIAHQSAIEWEIGIGTVTDGTPDTLSRTTILASSNSGSAVNLSSGTKDVFVTMPAESVPTLLSQATASSSATIDFTAFISAAYDRYFVDLVNIIPATDNVQLYLRVGTGAGPTWVTTNSYGYSSWQSDTSGGSGARASGSTAQIEIANGIANTSTKTGYCGVVDIFNPGSASLEKAFLWRGWRGNSGGAGLQNSGGGSYMLTTAVTGIRFLMSSGNIASGIFRVFGMPKF
jgi:hypothetical protein